MHTSPVEFKDDWYIVLDPDSGDSVRCDRVGEAVQVRKHWGILCEESVFSVRLKPGFDRMRMFAAYVLMGRALNN